MDLDALPATNSSPTSIKSWIRSSVKQSVQEKVAQTGHCQELHDYLNGPPVDSDDTTPLDLVAWWGVSHVVIALALADANSSFLQEHALRRYPTLARVARDYLPIQSSAVKCERAFSSSGQTITDRRNSLHPQTVGALQILKSAYAKGYVPADEEVRRQVVGVQQDDNSCIPPPTPTVGIALL